ncbi:MAG: hypothetical protein Q4A67_03640 [Aerococcus sp.]|nr:hypothetical protein [Aerococcus sp.]
MSLNLIASLLALVAVMINIYLIYRTNHIPLAKDTRKLLRTISIACLGLAIALTTFAYLTQLN